MRTCVLLFVISGVGCVAERPSVPTVAFAAARTPVPTTRAIHYDLRIDEALTTLVAKVRFEGAVPLSWSAVRIRVRTI
jgi:hypothetical protein